MTAQEFKQIVTLLKRYYRDDGFNEELSRLYWEAWRHLPFSVVNKAVKHAMMEIKGYGKVPQLPEFQPYIDRYKQRVYPGLPEAYKPYLAEEEEAQKHASTLPGEIQMWNIRLANTVVKAIMERKTADLARFVNHYAEQFATLWAERLEMDRTMEYDPYWKMPFSRYLEVLRGVHPDIAKTVQLAFSRGYHVGSH